MRLSISLVFLLAVGVFVYIGQNASNLSTNGIFIGLYEILDSGIEEEKEEKVKTLVFYFSNHSYHHLFDEFELNHAHSYLLFGYQSELPSVDLPPEPFLS
ncbi:MAG: hypothetical protein ACQEW9_16100 [Bacteroidota bacterium]|uniref:Uncharacterized protein n=1 Tax=Algoriphagus faecimaris TaxID=686796 RepID=A0A1G6VR42_9BACT|nr:hypothetical protein [Algoriphagus faecimaris]SDD56092.1 hypothetical protein SAMN04488104_103741 [Algoriphagus faecimaris]